jgi:hypothetical protein
MRMTGACRCHGGTMISRDEAKADQVPYSKELRRYCCYCCEVTVQLDFSRGRSRGEKTRPLRFVDHIPDLFISALRYRYRWYLLSYCIQAARDASSLAVHGGVLSNWDYFAAQIVSDRPRKNNQWSGVSSGKRVV